MSDTVDTESLRCQAPRWSLAGDEQLLKVLQHMHQKLITQCQQVDSRLEEMTTSLDDASISLQNVNNKFMALSNSQFIESRVYDDEVDVAPDTAQTKEPQAPPQSLPSIECMRRSVATLQRLHEPVTILDTDIDTDSDDEDEDTSWVVLRPRDLYASRPLPFIIGSHAWKSKWHAGLLVEDSDTDSTTSKHDKDLEQYSESECEEVPAFVPEGRDDGTISEDSSEMPSEQELPVARSQADVAAELARRLGGAQPQLVVADQSPTSYLPENAVKNIYRPKVAVAGTIFSDEPPPIEECQSEESDQGDIFAELHTNQPYGNSNTDRSRVPENLFDFNKTRSALSDFPNNEVAANPPAKQNSTLYDDESEPEMFAPKPERNAMQQTHRDTGAVKKPVGGISLFGSNKGADSIGAAILRRNERRTSSDDEATDIPQPITVKAKDIPVKDLPPKEKNVPAKTETQAYRATEKDIFNDLFAKPDKSQKIKEQIVEKEKKEVKKVDIFSDNLFDDIDDIFTSNVVKKEPSTKQKSLFDDDDDIFADIAVTKTIEDSKTINDEGLFDSDDDLFTDKLKMDSVKENKNNNAAVITSSEEPEFNKENENLINTEKTKKTETAKLIKSIFDDDSDSDIFSDLKPVPVNINANNSLNTDTIVKVHAINKLDTSSEETEELFSNNKDNTFIDKTIVEVQPDVNINSLNNNNVINKKPSIFYDDTVDIFSESETSTNIITDLGKEIQTSTNKIVNEILEEEDVNIPPNDIKPNIPTISKVPPTKDYNSDGSNHINTQSQSVTQSENNLTHREIEQKIHETDIYDAGKEALADISEEKSNYIFSSNEKGSDLAEADIFNTSPAHNIVTETLISDVKDLGSSKDTFSEIFTEPPVFEKPKEPKRSKNVNALFDDDSDDEGLFFRKSDVDYVKPETFQNKDMFDIFLDEPPAIDVDFTPHTNPTKFDSGDDIFAVPDDQSITSAIPDMTPGKLGLGNKLDSNKDIKESIEEISKPETVSVKLDLELPGDEEIIDNKLSSEIETHEGEVKKLNKLKMNIKIDVNTLLPGASPKKKNEQIHRQTEPTEEIDGQTSSTCNHEVLESIEEPVRDTKIIKSVNFDREPDSKILDNKLSKERAKIQVKRRPSTRRARKEAVRKSTIDLEDSTDNSSSLDDPPKSGTYVSRNILVNPPNVTVNIPETNVVKDLRPENSLDSKEVPKPTDVKSKIVYILHDEDIFNTAPVNDNRIPVSNENMVRKPKLNILDDDDDDDQLFKQNVPNNQANDVTDGVLTLGKSYEKANSNLESNNSKIQNETLNKDKHVTSLFGDDEDVDDELFKINKTVKKTGIFNTDSDEDLFTAKTARKTKVVEKMEVKGSLFGDEDDDGDLFGMKTKKIVPTSSFQSSKPSTSKETAASTELVFDDPLSLLGDDD